LPLSERFVLWAVRQWRTDRGVPTEGSSLHCGFKTAGILDALADFSIAMEAVFFGARRSLEIHQPTCSVVSGDEATLLALCTMAQIGYDAGLAGSLDVMIVPAASRVADVRLKAFASALLEAGLRLAPHAGNAPGWLH
jgi:hypothetical protein